MKKSEVKKLRKGQRVFYGGYEWKFYEYNGYVHGIDKEAQEKMDRKEYEGYIVILKAIDGKFYPMYGNYAPKDLCLDKIYWKGVSVYNIKEISL